MIKRTTQIKNILERLYARYNHRQFIPPDPLQFVYKYSSREDMEIAAFLSAILAYGRVQHIERSLTNLFARMGNSPFEFVKNFDAKKRAKLKGFKHRFTSGDCLSDLFWLLKKILNQYGSIEEFFLAGYNPSDKNIIPALSRFCDSLLAMHTAKHTGKANRELMFLLASPSRKSACKRLNLFLRWMVRNDDVDPGLWQASIDKTKLLVPIDVHTARLSRILGFHDKRVISLSVAVKITERFAEIEPVDPAKYDFALSRVGILENCTGRERNSCQACELFSICFN